MDLEDIEREVERTREWKHGPAGYQKDQAEQDERIYSLERLVATHDWKINEMYEERAAVKNRLTGAIIALLLAVIVEIFRIVSAHAIWK